jgi:hypothetical protein
MNKTDNKMPPALVELIANPEAERARIDFLGMAEKLIDEGMPVRTVARGLAGAITTLIAQEYPKGNSEFLWAWHFLRELEGGFGYWREHLDLIEDVADEIVRSREAGGCGNPYETRITGLEDRKIVLAEKIATTGRPVRSFDETLRTAFDFLASPCQLWTSERLEDKRTVLKLAFADRLAYVRNEGFRTPNFSLPFKTLGGLERLEKTMVPPTGIEPVSAP